MAPVTTHRLGVVAGIPVTLAAGEHGEKGVILGTGADAAILSPTQAWRLAGLLTEAAKRTGFDPTEAEPDLAGLISEAMAGD